MRTWGSEAPRKEVELVNVENGDKVENEEACGVHIFILVSILHKAVRHILHTAVRHTGVAGVHFSHKTAGILSLMFDIGGVFSGILVGLISDVIEARAVTSVAFLLLSIPAIVLYRAYGCLSVITNITLLFLSSLLVNGPYSLTTTAVAADLGTQDLIKGNSRALATVTAIIDVTGSVEAALGPILAVYISTRGWNSVFFMLIVSIFFAGLFLICVVTAEIREKLNEAKWDWNSVITQRESFVVMTTHTFVPQ